MLLRFVKALKTQSMTFLSIIATFPRPFESFSRSPRSLSAEFFQIVVRNVFVQWGYFAVGLTCLSARAVLQAL